MMKLKIANSRAKTEIRLWMIKHYMRIKFSTEVNNSTGTIILHLGDLKADSNVSKNSQMWENGGIRLIKYLLLYTKLNSKN